jgi:pimeloyl-ACP methyl ester carboxylesterase
MPEEASIPLTTIHRIAADGVTVFYREAGPANAPVVLLLHGFPTSSFQYRELIPRLAGRYRVIAPDLPGFGFTEVPAGRNYTYTFDALAATILAFTNALKLTRYALYVFDYGAPTGFRLAMAHPERVTAIVSQNGNAYEEGLGDAWAPIQLYWREPTEEHRNNIRQALTAEGMKREYSVGIPNPEQIAPEGYTLDAALLARPGNVEIQLDLFLDLPTTSSSTQSFTSTSANHGRHCWPSGAGLISTSSRPARKPSAAIFPAPKYNFSTPATSPSKRMYSK